MKRERNRIDSFTIDNICGKSTILAAKSGLYLDSITNGEINLKCAFCYKKFLNWKFENFIKKHYSESPTCSFFRLFNGNLKDEYNEFKYICGIKMKFEKFFKNSQYLSFTKRKESCRNNFIFIKCDVLAEAGFFCVNGVANCFVCKMEIGQFGIYDDPFKMHNKNCLYMDFISIYGKMYKDYLPHEKKIIFQSYKEHGNSKVTFALSKLCTITKDGIENVIENTCFSNIADELCCKICYEKKIYILFGPCKHAVCCKDCSFKMINCPICRQEIVTKDEIYLI